MIYRLLCGRAFSVRKSLRAVRTVERNRYIENTPLGTPSGTAVGGKQLFFWLQKSGVNNRKRRRCNWSGNTTPPARKCCSVGGIKAQVCPFAVNRSRFGLRYSRVRGRRQSKFLASSSTGGARNFYPSIRSEAPSFIVARAAKPPVFGAKRQTQNVFAAKRHKHSCLRYTGEPRFARSRRGANLTQGSREARTIAAVRASCTGEPRFALNCRGVFDFIRKAHAA